MKSPKRFSGERLRQLRLRRGMTQEQLARRADEGVKSIANWEREKHGPTADALASLAFALDVDVDELFAPADGDAEEGPEPAERLRDVATQLRQHGLEDLAEETLAVARGVVRDRRAVGRREADRRKVA